MMRYQVRVLRNILSKPVFLYSTSVPSNEQTVKPVFKRLLDEFPAAKTFISALKRNDMMNVSFSDWKSRIDVMKECGFSDVNCFQMISKCPFILDIDLVEFRSTILQWLMSNLGSENVISILLEQPELLEVDEADIRARIPQLRVIFGSANSITMILKNSPSVMSDDWETVLMKINYLIQERRYKAGEVAQCGILSKSLDFIKFRFDLLEKCGVYKQSNVPVHKENKRDRSGHINPTLKNILMTNTKQFGKIACISEEEYEVYRDLFMANEYENENEDEDEDEDDYGSKLQTR